MTTPPVPHTPPADEQWVDVAPLLTQIRVAARMDRMDVPLPVVEAEVVQRRAAYLLARAADLLTHPEDAAPGVPATAGERSEYRHLLYDADEDATIPAFPYPTQPLEAS